MSVGTAIRQGLGMTRRTGTGVWVLFLANLGLAALSALPVYRGILRFTGHSLMNRSMLQGFSMDWLTDFWFNSWGSFDRYAALIAAFGLLSILVNAVLAGGVLARFRDPSQPQGLRAYCRDTGRYAWRMVRLMIIGLICYWIVFRLLNQSLSGMVEKWMRNATNDRTVFWAHLPVALLTLGGVIFVNLVMDYAKVKLVIDDDSSAIEAFLASLGFSLGKLRKALTVYFIPALLGLALLGLYRLVVPWDAIHGALGAAAGWRYSEPLVLALLFIGQQVVMLGRYWFRVATWASEWSYYSGAR